MNPLRRIRRREFLEDSFLLALAASFGAVPTARAADSPTTSTGANETIRVAVIGVRSQGGSHIQQLLKQNDIRITVICDCDRDMAERGVKTVEEKTGQRPKLVQDLRRVFDDKNVDAVTIATPNHWHALAAIWACQAGKDVYVEKPVSHNVGEGRKIVEAARKYKRMVQSGTQGRSHKAIQAAVEMVRSGKLGKCRLARGLCYKPRASIGKISAPIPPPSNVDYDLWLGPAPQKPVVRQQFHYDWHWFWDYGNGDIGNQGIHQMDIARWGLGKNSLCSNVVSVGGRFGYVDDGQTPNTQLAFLNYGDSQILFEVRGLKTDEYRGVRIGNIFHCDNGYVVCTSDYGKSAVFDNKGEKLAEYSGGGDHIRNWLDAVRSRNPGELTADIEEGHLSSALCHLANISHLLGSPKIYSKQDKPFGKNETAYETFENMRRHLHDNGVDLTAQKIQFGQPLRFNPNAENFGRHRSANALLTRDYRAPFIVPAKV